MFWMELSRHIPKWWVIKLLFILTKKTKTFEYYSQFFDTVEMIQTFYKKFYKKMEKDLFIWLTEISPEF